MRNRLLFALAIIGILAGFASAYVFGIQAKAAAARLSIRPRIRIEKGIYANGIIESYQSSGENINIYPEVSGVITKILVSEGETVHRGGAAAPARRFNPKSDC